MFIRNVIADMVAVFKHPEFRPAACLRRYALTLYCWHKPVASALNNQQRALYFIRHPLQVELPQFVHGILYRCGFKAMNVRFAADYGALREALNGVIRAAVFNRRPQPAFEG